MEFTKDTFTVFIKTMTSYFEELKNIHPDVIFIARYSEKKYINQYVLSMNIEDSKFEDLAKQCNTSCETHINKSLHVIDDLLPPDYDPSISTFMYHDDFKVINTIMGKVIDDINISQIEQISKLSKKLDKYTLFFDNIETNINIGCRRIFITFCPNYDMNDPIMSDIILILEDYFNDLYENGMLIKEINGLTYMIMVDGVDAISEDLEY